MLVIIILPALQHKAVLFFSYSFFSFYIIRKIAIGAFLSENNVFAYVVYILILVPANFMR